MKIKVEQEYKPTVDELALEIWNLDAEEQLYLLNELSAVSDIYHILMQMQSMADEKNEYHLYQDGCKFIETLNEYLNGE